MSREKQIEEMANTINEMDEPNAHYYGRNMKEHEAFADCFTIAKHLYNAGYRKQREAMWVDNHCTACGMTPIGEEMWTHHGETPPKFEYFMSFCSCCGAKMKGGEK